MAQSAPSNTNLTNIKKLLLPITLAKAGWAIVEAREDVQGVPYDVTAPKAELHRLLEDAAGVALSVQPFSDPELDAGPEPRSRLAHRRRLRRGRRAGADPAQDPADDRRHRQFGQRRRGRHLSDDVAGAARRGDGHGWSRRAAGATATRSRCRSIIYGKTVLIIGFGKIGTRSARRFAAMEMQRAGLRPVHVFRDDPRHRATSRSAISTRRWRAPISSRSTARRRRRRSGCSTPRGSAHMKRTAFIVNTARGGIIDEKALHDALKAEPHRRRRARRLRPGADPERQPAPDARQFHRRAAYRRGDARGGRPHGASSRCRTCSQRPRRQAEPRQRRQQGSAGLTSRVAQPSDRVEHGRHSRD